MKILIFTVNDSKAALFLQPFFSRNAQTAKRSFSEAVNDAGHQFHKHAGDYTLFEIGSFDEETGVVTPHKVQTNMGLATIFLEAPEMPNLSELFPGKANG